MRAKLGCLLSTLLDLLAASACSACDGPCAAGEAFCSSCVHRVELCSPTTLDGVPLHAGGRYWPPLSDAVARFKYQGRAELARPLARLMWPALSAIETSSATALVPVPLHPRRLAERGYNQAALLAQQLASQSRLDCWPRLLRRRRETPRQVGKSRDERVQNTQHAFEVRQVGPTSVVLVDDVVTTGSTVRACAQALEQGGVAVVAVVALARAEHAFQPSLISL